jgi:hypothetical protein
MNNTGNFDQTEQHPLRIKNQIELFRGRPMQEWAVDAIAS